MLKKLLPITLVVLALLLQHWLRSVVGSRYFLLLYPAVFVGSLFSNFAWNALGVVVATLGAWYLFIPDLLSFHLAEPKDAFSIAVFFSTGLIANFLGSRVKAAEAAKDVAEQAKIFDTALSSSPDFHYIFDTRHRFTYVNRALLELWGRTLDEAVGKNFEELGYPKELVELHETQLNQVLQGRTVKGENAYTSPSGETRHYEYVFVPIFGPDRKVQAISGTTRDVSERKRSEELRLDRLRTDLLLGQARESESQFRALADSMPQLAWIARRDGYIFWYNEGWYRYTGKSAAEMEGWGWQSVHDPVHLGSVMERWQESIATGMPFEMEFPLRSASGDFRWFLTRVTPVRDSSGEIVRWFGTNTDIHEQRSTRDALSKALESRDDFLSIASHELKTPITSLKLQLQMTERRLRSLAPEDRAKWSRVDLAVGTSLKQVDRVTALIEDLLDVSRIQSGKISFDFQPIDPAVVTQEVVDRLCDPEIDVRCAVELRLQDGIIAHWDRGRFEQVVINLLANALKYAPGRPIAVSLKSDGDVVTLIVEDKGPGIPEERLPHIFERYERATSSRHISGLGLGLFIVRRIVEAHRGSVTVQSKLGAGTKFLVQMPVRPELKELKDSITSTL